MFNYVVLILFIAFKSEQVFFVHFFDTVNDFPNVGDCFVLFCLLLLLYCLYLVWQDAFYCNHVYEG